MKLLTLRFDGPIGMMFAAGAYSKPAVVGGLEVQAAAGTCLFGRN